MSPAHGSALVMKLFVHIQPRREVLGWADMANASSKRAALHAYALRCLRHCLGLSDNQALHMQYNVHGKPHLIDHPEWQFSLSHSKHHFALVCGQTDSALGIDIESYPRNIRAAVINASLSPQEQLHYQQAAEPLRYWLQVWTIKEALLKAAGTGIQQDLRCLDTGFDGKKAQGHITLPPHSYTYQNHDHDDCVWTLAWQQPANTVEWHDLVLPTSTKD